MILQNYSGADPGFFVGGGALVSCSNSTSINHIVFVLQNTSRIRKPQVISGWGGGGCTPCSRFSLHHYVISPFMESVGHVLSEIKQSSSCC